MTYPNLLFEVSWEVCNKVGGIYTVLSTHTQALRAKLGDGLVFIGPDVWKGKDNPVFCEDAQLFPDWQKAAMAAGIPIRVGRWQIPGAPLAVLVDFSTLFAEKNQIYTWAWEHYRVDSLHAYGDYDEASMFSFAAGKLVVTLAEHHLLDGYPNIVYHAHEWMSGMGMLWVKQHCPDIATVFTTHATSIGRSIAGNNKLLYAYFNGYHGDQMAQELNMQSKHSIEKQSAWAADCFTTVSTFTDRECRQLLDKGADVVLPNGFEGSFVPCGKLFDEQRGVARQRILTVANALTGRHLTDETIILSTSGRNDFRCKGFDVFLDSLARLRQNNSLTKPVLALIEVPCWCTGPRKDLQERLLQAGEASMPMPHPYVTHEIYNFNEDLFIRLMQEKGLTNAQTQGALTVLLLPCYLDGRDGIFNLPYYQLLSANDLCVYPSYYEPWGYTPLESVAFHVPSITTDLSGFGQWAEGAGLASQGIAGGLHVLHRTDDNYDDVVGSICHDISLVCSMQPSILEKARQQAAKIAQKARWEDFIVYYFKAYDLALKKRSSFVGATLSH